MRELALQRPDADGAAFYNSWVRHAVTEAARANAFLEVRDGRRVEISLLTLAKAVVENVATPRPDVAADDERILDSLCRFDVLAALVAIHAASSTNSRYFYTSFAHFDSDRVRSILRLLITDDELRAAVFPGDDAELARALRELLRLASSEAARFSHFFVDYGDDVDKFIQDNDSNP
jgi:hypothetical protein